MLVVLFDLVYVDLDAARQSTVGTIVSSSWTGSESLGKVDRTLREAVTIQTNQFVRIVTMLALPPQQASVPGPGKFKTFQKGFCQTEHAQVFRKSINS